VVFVPFGNGKPTRRFEIFADGFAGSDKRPARARHRPVGIAEAPDGALFLSDDAGGRIWRITYSASGHKQ
jgi:glucose/arabinose dehydrogenase